MARLNSSKISASSDIRCASLPVLDGFAGALSSKGAETPSKRIELRNFGAAGRFSTGIQELIEWNRKIRTQSHCLRRTTVKLNNCSQIMKRQPLTAGKRRWPKGSARN